MRAGVRAVGRAAGAGPTPAANRCRRKFLRFFPGGFKDETYIDWERAYKQAAHERWEESLSRPTFSTMLREGRHTEIAATAVRIESRTNLLFSFEKMALRDAVRSAAGAKAFAAGLYELLYGSGSEERKFERWVEAVGTLPRRQTRVLTWPVVTVFPFIAAPERHIFMKPKVTMAAAREYGFEFGYATRPAWGTYASLLAFAARVRRDLRAFPSMRARDMIDLQSFIWVQGSDEYEEGGKHGEPAG